MTRQPPTRRRALGLGLAAFTALIWGTIPVILKILTARVDAYTLSWFRFLLSAILLLPILLHQQTLRPIFRIRGIPVLMLCLAALGLCGNYLTFQAGLGLVSPGSAQVVIQLAPMFVLLGGLWLFREPFSRLQWLGFGLLAVGLGLFFNPHYDELLSASGSYAGGVGLVGIAAILWAVYMLAQKQLVPFMSSESVLFVICVCGAAVFLPFASFAQVAALDRTHLVLLVSVSAMTMVSYLLFGKALDHVEISRVGVLVALTPLVVVLGTTLVAAAFPHLMAPERLNAYSVAGAGLVVAGTMCGSLGNPDA